MEKLILPADYTQLSADEMNYTQGGTLIGLASTSLFIYNYIWGLSETRNWLKKNKTGSAVTTAVKAYGATSDYVSSSLFNTVRGVITAMQFSALWPITAVAWLTAKKTTSTSRTGSSSVYSSVTSSDDTISSGTSDSYTGSGTKVIQL